MHLVKRFGIIGASQLPIHYILAIKHPYNPLQLIYTGSRRHLLSLHFFTGRISLLLLAIHAILYSSVFIRMSIFQQSIRQPKIAVALISVAVFGTMAVTSLRSFRRRNHFLFYRVHVVGSAIVLPLLFFHVQHIRTYVLQCAVVVVSNALLRKFAI